MYAALFYEYSRDILIQRTDRTGLVEAQQYSLLAISDSCKRVRLSDKNPRLISDEEGSERVGEMARNWFRAIALHNFFAYQWNYSLFEATIDQLRYTMTMQISRAILAEKSFQAQRRKERYFKDTIEILLAGIREEFNFLENKLDGSKTLPGRKTREKIASMSRPADSFSVFSYNARVLSAQRLNLRYLFSEFEKASSNDEQLAVLKILKKRLAKFEKAWDEASFSHKSNQLYHITDLRQILERVVSDDKITRSERKEILRLGSRIRKKTGKYLLILHSHVSSWSNPGKYNLEISDSGFLLLSNAVEISGDEDTGLPAAFDPKDVDVPVYIAHFEPDQAPATRGVLEEVFDIQTERTRKPEDQDNKIGLVNPIPVADLTEIIDHHEGELYGAFNKDDELLCGLLVTSNLSSMTASGKLAFAAVEHLAKTSHKGFADSEGIFLELVTGRRKSGFPNEMPAILGKTTEAEMRPFDALLEALKQSQRRFMNPEDIGVKAQWMYLWVRDDNGVSEMYEKRDFVNTGYSHEFEEVDPASKKTVKVKFNLWAGLLVGTDVATIHALNKNPQSELATQ